MFLGVILLISSFKLSQRTDFLNNFNFKKIMDIFKDLKEIFSGHGSNLNVYEQMNG